ncbi:MAG: phosphodiesterase [bacterium ADurb.Bin478]|nr:MAG: phosphodiesterase [bacterium ADurb.Bin478]
MNDSLEQQPFIELPAPCCRIGVLSDTHRRLPEAVFSLFADVQHIIHAGDIGDWDIVLSLQTLAPVTAVYGNCDDYRVRRHCPLQQTLRVNGLTVQVTHISQEAPEEAPESLQKIQIYGHSHVASIQHFGSTLFINPGSISRPRQDQRPSVALLQVDGEQPPRAEILSLR